MCSACSGDYEADGDRDEDWEAGFSEAESLQAEVGDGWGAFGGAGKSVGSGDRMRRREAGQAVSVDEYEVFVSDERIVEVRKVSLNSPCIRHFEAGEGLSGQGDWAFSCHSGLESASNYRTPIGSGDSKTVQPESSRKRWTGKRLTVIERFARLVRRALG